MSEATVKIWVMIMMMITVLMMMPMAGYKLNTLSNPKPVESLSSLFLFTREGLLSQV